MTLHSTLRDAQDVDSVRAGGHFIISRTAASILTIHTESFKARVTTWLVEQHHLGDECPEIMSNTLDDIKCRKALSIHVRADRLLKYVALKAPTIGEQFEFILQIEPNEPRMEMLAWSESCSLDELLFLIEYLTERRWITQQCRTSDSIPLMITVGGYERLAELETKAVDSKQAFIAMWFDPSLNLAYENGIKLGVEDAGYMPLRIDQKNHNNKIDDEIIAEIRRSRFLVADFTQEENNARGGVYYEAGFAQGLGIPVIFTCRKNAIDKVHFDTRQYNHITWDTPEELRIRLSQRISATIGDGPMKEVE